MNKVLASVVLCASLLAPCGTVLAEGGRAGDPRWGLKPGKKSSSTLLDLARWLSSRLQGTAGLMLPEPRQASPSTSAPVSPTPDGSCDRVHCPIG